MTTGDKAHGTGKTGEVKHQCLRVKGKKRTQIFTDPNGHQSPTTHAPWSPVPHLRAMAPLLQVLHILRRNPVVPSPNFFLFGVIYSYLSCPLGPTLGSQGLACPMVPLKPGISSTSLANPGWMTTARSYLQKHPLLEARGSFNWNTHTEDSQRAAPFFPFQVS